MALFNKNIEKSFSSRLDSLRHQLKQEQEEQDGPERNANDRKKGTKKNLAKPAWLKAQVPAGVKYESLRSTVKSLNLATVCEEAKCPNIGGRCSCYHLLRCVHLHRILFLVVSLLCHECRVLGRG